MTSSLSPSPGDIDLVKSQFHKVLLMLEIRDFVLYSQPVGIIHRLRWFFKTRSAGTYEGRMRSDEGMLERRVCITHGLTMCARHAHARNTLEERWESWACVRSTLGERSWCARSAIDLSRRTHNACPSCAPECVSRWSTRSVRISGVLLACAFIRRAPRTFLCMHKNPDARNE